MNVRCHCKIRYWLNLWIAELYKIWQNTLAKQEEIQSRFFPLKSYSHFSLPPYSLSLPLNSPFFLFKFPPRLLVPCFFYFSLEGPDNHQPPGPSKRLTNPPPNQANTWLPLWDAWNYLQVHPHNLISPNSWEFAYVIYLGWFFIFYLFTLTVCRSRGYW